MAHKPTFGTSAVWAAFGGASAALVPPLGAALTAVALGSQLREVSEARRWHIAVVVAIACVCYVLTWVFALGASLIAGAIGFCALVVAFIMALLVVRGKAGLTADYAVAAIGACALGVLDFCILQMKGLTISDALHAYVAGVVQEGALDTDMQQVIAQGENMLVIMMPFVLFCVVGIDVLLAHLAVRLTTPAEKAKPFNLALFDAPYWTMLVFLLGVACCVCGVWAPSLLGLGLSVCEAMRFVFLVQGLAVISWWLTKLKAGCLIRIVVLVCAFYLEVFFFALSIVGFIDFWANFRKLPRGPRLSARKQVG